ncbi:hypothetical protein RJ639_009420 [Escallonia herrerae]|uniref:Major facilitator superfamily (MFS) profile domain-containing protein n=1 Tax=Escallonia herrerae TaxID=1293975 RepID=A0AA88VRF4_9ASTE|nr:hypothetical protein RJ639_009420 [Escallonia herrerae]
MAAKRVMNGPIVSVAQELGFEGNSILEGLVVSIFKAGAFVGSICSGSIVDKLGCRRTLQIDTVPLILGALISAQAHSSDELLLGRFLVGLGIGVTTVLVPIYISEAGRADDARKVVHDLWGPSEVNKAMEEFQPFIRNDGDDLQSGWLELLEEPHCRGCIKGRQRLLTGSYLGMAVSMFVIAYAISFPMDEELSHNLSIMGTLLYIFTFAIGAGPATGLIIPELSSSRTRGKIMGFSFSVHWVCNFLVGLFFLELVERLGVAPVYATFGAVSLLAATFAYFFIVETKGRSLEEIEMSLNSSFPRGDE